MRSCLVLAVGATVTLLGCGGSAGTPAGGSASEASRATKAPRPAQVRAAGRKKALRKRPFRSNGIWNRPLAADAPILDIRSDAWVDRLADEVQSEFDNNQYGPQIAALKYSVPVYRVPRTQPRVPVQLLNDSEFAEGMRRAFASVPIPPDAVPAAGTDGHLVVWQRSTDTMWEFFRLQQGPAGWQAGWGGRIRHVSRNPGFFKQEKWGATATGLPLLGGLITLSELRRGKINHALALAIPHPLGGYWLDPAQRGDGDGPSDAIIEGARFRLDPSFDVNSLKGPPLVRALARAAQRYGIILRDKSGLVSFYGEDPARTGANPYEAAYGGLSAPELLTRFPWRRLEVVKPKVWVHQVALPDQRLSAKGIVAAPFLCMPGCHARVTGEMELEGEPSIPLAPVELDAQPDERTKVTLRVPPADVKRARHAAYQRRATVRLQLEASVDGLLPNAATQTIRVLAGKS